MSIRGHACIFDLQHANPCNPTHMHANKSIPMYTSICTQFLDHSSVPAYTQMSTLTPHILPSTSEWMTFQTNRNAGSEDCFNCIYCQKAKPRWKTAKMKAVARQGSFAFRLRRRARLFVFALSSFFSFFFSLILNFAEFMLGILGRLLFFTLPKASRAKKA